VLKTNQKARQNPKALAQLDAYKRGLVNSLTGNLQRFGFERVAKVETLQKIIDEMRGMEQVFSYAIVIVVTDKRQTEKVTSTAL
jgi:hypothetical protein